MNGSTAGVDRSENCRTLASLVMIASAIPTPMSLRSPAVNSLMTRKGRTASSAAAGGLPAGTPPRRANQAATRIRMTTAIAHQTPRARAGATAASGGSVTSSIGAMKRYPRRARVSTYRGVSAESPSACRTFLMAVFRPCSKSTNVSAGHNRCRRSSRVKTSPGRSSSAARICAGCSCSRTGCPSRHSSRPPSANSNWPNRSRRPGEGKAEATAVARV